MHVAVSVSVGPDPERQRTIFTTSDEYLIGVLLDSLRFRLGYVLPEEGECDEEYGLDQPPPPFHQPG